MLKSFEQKYVRKMAKIYRMDWQKNSIRQAIFEASRAYDIYREAEVEMMQEEYFKGDQNNA